MESIGILVYRGLPLELIDDFFSVPIMQGWERPVPHVEDLREEVHGPQGREWYRWLHDRLAERHRTTPRVPAHVRLQG